MWKIRQEIHLRTSANKACLSECRYSRKLESIYKILWAFHVPNFHPSRRKCSQITKRILLRPSRKVWLLHHRFSQHLQLLDEPMCRKGLSCTFFHRNRSKNMESMVGRSFTLLGKARLSRSDFSYTHACQITFCTELLHRISSKSDTQFSRYNYEKKK